MLNEELLSILRCPADQGQLQYVHGKWLVCQTCDRKYPIREDIPVMLIEEGDRYRDTPVEALPDPDAEQEE
ncbi:MAG: hypothetical protein M5U01_27475 [Ardenticatenaceae bacterium]|nr:hypothetical protein [Ardenticatenaceae bacterium]